MFIALAWLALSAAQAQSTRYELGTNVLSVGPAAGSNSVALAVTPATGTWTATTNAAWLHLSAANQSGTGSTNVIFIYDANLGAARIGTLTIAGLTLTVTQSGPTFSLAAGALLMGPNAGSNSIVLAVAPYTASWTASANAAWLHLNAANQNGTGSTNVVFGCDANSGATRVGSLTIAGQMLLVTQAGSTYVPAGAMTDLVTNAVENPEGVAVDGAGNVYIADTFRGAIKEWLAANNTVVDLVASGLEYPVGVRLDGAGNVYFAQYFNNLISELPAAGSNVITLASSGLDQPHAVAVDGAGDVYIADAADNAIKEWTAANSNLTTLISSGLSDPDGVAVDKAGNVYLSDRFHDEIRELAPTSTNLTTLSGVFGPTGMVVDASGNVYVAGEAGNSIEKWTAASNTVSTMVSSGVSRPEDVAVDGAGNIYIADTGNYAIKELPYAFVDPTPRSESAAAGADALPVVLPSTENLLPPFSPTSDQPWLAISGIANGVVSFSFGFNPGSSRTAHITLLNQSIAITQQGAGIMPPILAGPQILSGGTLQFSFTNSPMGSFTVLSTTNLSLPLGSWTVVGAATNLGGGEFQFDVQPPTNAAQSFYTVRSP